MKDKTLRLWNRDLATTLSFGHILMSQRENGIRPERFCRYNKRKYDPIDTPRINKRSNPSLIAGASVD
ncbi:hypothetical protein BDF14DRAFT_1819343 [Spinellus fusiger]|nr:hypothetical protein BDF14DRAFT_1819343 [Spinellus fusiger]